MKFVAFLLFSIFVEVIFSSCPNGSIEFQKSCYYFYANATQFPDAELACISMKGHLVSIHDGFTNAILTSESSKFFHDSTTVDFWIGLNSLMTPGNWSWTDNTAFDFKDWSPKKPQNLSMNNCATVAIKNGLWASSDCFKIKPYVCETTTLIAPTTTSVSTTLSYPAFVNCSEGWVYFQPTHSCYGHDGYNYQTGTWAVAEKRCENQNAHLPSLHSYDEMRFLWTLATLTNIVDLWTGLHSNDNEVTWKWSDGSPVDFLPWHPGRPNLNVSSCGYLYRNAIYDENCSSNIYFICKKPATL